VAGRERTVRHALHQAHVEANLVPLDDSAFNLEEGQADARLCDGARVDE